MGAPPLLEIRSTFIRPALVHGVQRLGRGLIALEMRDGAIVAVGPSYVKAVVAQLGLPPDTDGA